MTRPISAVVLTKNEEQHIENCLRSLKWADEILVVDSISTDETAAIAGAAGARVVAHPFQDFANQRNFAEQAASNDWILFVDADERVSPDLAIEIQRLATSEAIDRHQAYHIRRVHMYSGRWLFADKNGRFSRLSASAIRRNEVPRLVNRRYVRWERPLHEVAVVNGRAGVLNGVIYHYSLATLSLAYETLNQYTDMEAAYVAETRRRSSLLEAFGRGFRSFVYQYVVAGYWRSGSVGLLLAIQLAYTKFLTYAKLWERLRIEAGDGEWSSTDKMPAPVRVRGNLNNMELAQPETSAPRNEQCHEE